MTGTVSTPSRRLSRRLAHEEFLYTLKSGSGAVRCETASARWSCAAREQDRPAVPGSAGSHFRGLGGAGLLVCGWWPRGRVEKGPAALRAAGGDDPADWLIASDPEHFREIREFYVASVSVLVMPRLWGSLRLCWVSCVGRVGNLRLRRRLSICQEVTYSFTTRAKHERRNRWRLTTAVFDLALAVPVLMVATGFQKPASAADVNVTIEYQEAKPNPCAP